MLVWLVLKEARAAQVARATMEPMELVDLAATLELKVTPVTLAVQVL